MAIALTLTIAGTVASGVVKVIANGVEATLNGTNYTAVVPVSSTVIALTSVFANGTESVRTVQIVATGTAPV